MSSHDNVIYIDQESIQDQGIWKLLKRLHAYTKEVRNWDVTFSTSYEDIVQSGLIPFNLQERTFLTIRDKSSHAIDFVAQCASVPVLIQPQQPLERIAFEDNSPELCGIDESGILQVCFNNPYSGCFYAELKPYVELKPEFIKESQAASFAVAQGGTEVLKRMQAYYSALAGLNPIPRKKKVRQWNL